GRNDPPVISFDDNGNAVIAWSHADVPDVNWQLGTMTEDQLDTLLAFSDSYDLDSATLSNGVWSSAQKIVSAPGQDTTPTLQQAARDLVLAWVNKQSSGAPDQVMASVWNGAVWSTPSALASGTMTGTLTAGSVGGHITVFWTQDISNDPSVRHNAIFSSTF